MNVNVVLAKVNPVGKVSSTCRLVIVAGFAAGLVKTKVRLVLLPPGRLAAPNDLVSVGAP